jgi:hypothetical protein
MTWIERHRWVTVVAFVLLSTLLAVGCSRSRAPIVVNQRNEQIRVVVSAWLPRGVEIVLNNYYVAPTATKSLDVIGSQSLRQGWVYLVQVYSDEPPYQTLLSRTLGFADFEMVDWKITISQ